MKFTISLKDKRILTLFKFGCDYLDVQVSKTRFVATASTPGMTVLLTLPVETVQDYEEVQVFRIPKAGFFSLVREGIVSFLCEEDRVYIRMENNKVVHSMKFDRQICDISKLDDILKALRQVNSYPRFEVHDLILPVKILKNSPSSITIDNKIAVSAMSGLQLYAKTAANDCAVFPAALSHLLAVCDTNFDKVYNMKDQIVFSDGLNHVLINKVSPGHSNDIHFVMKQKVVYKATVDFEQAMQLLLKIRDYTEAELDLRRQQLILRAKNVEYSAGIVVTQRDLEKAAVDGEETDLAKLLEEQITEVPQVRFPAEVFKNIITAVKSKTLEIVCTKNRVRVSIRPGLMIVFRKEI